MGNFLPVQSQSHSIKDYVITFLIAGVPVILTSHGDDSESFSYEHISAEKNTVKEDCVGNAHWSLNPGEAGKIKFKLMHTNPMCAQLQAMYAAATPIKTVRNTATFTVNISTNTGRLLITGQKCRIEGPPSGSRGKEVGSLEWTVTASALIINEQGEAIDLL